MFLTLKPRHRYWGANESVRVVFSREQNEKYRYLLECNWDNEQDKVTFLLLNPSIADYEICDPTLNRCVEFSKSWGYGGMKIVNLFAHISTDPDKLLNHVEPVEKKMTDIY
nr:DUF1643 domain-containing protein [Sporosarcina sp.]